MIHRKKKLIPELTEGEHIQDIFVVKIKKAIVPYAKGYSFNLLLSDSTTRTIDFRFWGGPDENAVQSLFDSISPDDVLYIEGKVSTYRGKLQLASDASSTIKVLAPEEYEISDFIPPARRDLDALYKQLLTAISTVKDMPLRNLLTDVFTDSIIQSKFKVHPAAIEIHHNWKGGLLTHTVELLRYVELTHRMFPNTNLDLLIAGTLLHDIGKLSELDVSTRIKGTTRGQLLGHLALSALYVSKKCKEHNIDRITEEKLLHIILAHHGKVEYGSPKPPMTAEALAVYLADEYSSKMAEMLEFIARAKADTEDDFMYNRRKEHNIYLG